MENHEELLYCNLNIRLLPYVDSAQNIFLNEVGFVVASLYQHHIMHVVLAAPLILFWVMTK